MWFGSGSDVFLDLVWTVWQKLRESFAECSRPFIQSVKSTLSLRPERPFTGVSGPSWPKIAKKSQKESFWGSAKKVPENTPKSQKIPKIGLFSVFFDFFGYFRGLFCRTPKRLFLRLFCDFGPGGPGDSCKWLLGSQPFLLTLRVGQPRRGHPVKHRFMIASELRSTILCALSPLSPCRKRSPAKGVWQKSDEKSDKSVRKSDRKVTESVPKTKKSDRTPFAALLLRHPDPRFHQ